ncbi:hypothetical protein J4404_01755, partial [Candidatus Woesearchaeota archaeon]|nr:hypothetical protein [Candidatus Woesearchaeota archaeon]
RDIFGNIIDETPILTENVASNSCWARVPNGIDTNTLTDWVFQLCTKNTVNNLVVNTPPTISGLLDQGYLQDSGLHDNVIDIWNYAADAQDADSAMTYTIISETNTAVVDCSIDANRYIDCIVQPGVTGSSDVTVQVMDVGGLTAQDTFTVVVILPLSACSDTTDNDGDGNIDNGDIGCYGSLGYDSTDNNEADPAIPLTGVDIFFYDMNGNSITTIPSNTQFRVFLSIGSN